MSYAIRFHETGGPEVLRWEHVPVAKPAPGEVLIRHEAVGLNFIDVYHRTGLYPMPLPSGIGQEGAGIVEAIGDGVSFVKPGDRVAYAALPLGAYSQTRCYLANHLVKLPESIDCTTAAAMLLQGMTSAYLLRHTYRVKAGDTVLIHAAAGGVGSIACQWAKALGATVIGTVSSDEKAVIAKQNGCDHIIFYTRDDVAARVREITQGEGVNVVYDGVGKDTFMASFDCLRPRGMMVSFGNASGAVPPFSPLLLSQKGSLFLTRPTLAHYSATHAELLALADEVFAVVASGKVKITIGQTYPLKEAAAAHRDLEARKTIGSSVLIP